MDGRRAAGRARRKGGLPKELQRAIRGRDEKGGWGPDLARGGWKWTRIEGGYYRAPGGYRSAPGSLLAADIDGRMQELMLGDLASSRDEPIPPQYQEFVDRYYQVLATEGKESGSRVQAVAPKKDQQK